MVLLDMDMPDSCDDCEMLSDFGDGTQGCALTAIDVPPGLIIVHDVHERAPHCRLHSVDVIFDILASRYQELADEPMSVEKASIEGALRLLGGD